MNGVSPKNKKHMNVTDDKLRERVEKIKTPIGEILFRFELWFNFMIGRTNRKTFWLFLNCCDTLIAPWDRWTVFVLSVPYGEKYKTITRYISWMERQKLLLQTENTISAKQ
jgi:hypothetical protein